MKFDGLEVKKLRNHVKEITDLNGREGRARWGGEGSLFRLHPNEELARLEFERSGDASGSEGLLWQSR